MGGSSSNSITVLLSVDKHLKRKKGNDDEEENIDDGLTKPIFRFFFEEIVKKASQHLPHNCRTLRFSNIKNFIIYDGTKMPTVYPEDWQQFCESMNTLLQNH